MVRAHLWYPSTSEPVRESLFFYAMFALLGGCGLVGYQSASLTGDASVRDGAVPRPDGGVAEDSLAFACGYENATVILDGDAVDARVGAALADSLAAGCGTSPTVRSLSQDTAGLLDPDTDAPLLGPNDLGIVGGAAFYQRVMGYLQMSLTPLASSDATGRLVVRLRATNAVLLDVALETITASHDYAIIQIVHDPSTGSTVLTAYGQLFGGTLAGAYYFAENIAPTLTTETRGYFLVEWTNVDADVEPSAGDTFELLATGP